VPDVVKERPILYSTPMVQALLDGTKTQTRRVMVPQPQESYSVDYGPCGATTRRSYGWEWKGRPDDLGVQIPGDSIAGLCPHGLVGGRLWVRETWRTHERPEDHVDGVLFAADGSFVPIENSREAADRWVAANHVREAQSTRAARFPMPTKRATGWRPSIHMPRWASRITLEITDVRVERAMDISDEDIVSEGIAEYAKGKGLVWSTPDRRRALWADLWDGVNLGRKGGDYAWDRDPWTWVIAFRRLEANRAATA